MGELWQDASEDFLHEREVPPSLVMLLTSSASPLEMCPLQFAKNFNHHHYHRPLKGDNFGFFASFLC